MDGCSAVCIMNELENGRNKGDSEREAIEIGIHQQLKFRCSTFVCPVSGNMNINIFVLVLMMLMKGMNESI